MSIAGTLGVSKGDARLFLRGEAHDQEGGPSPLATSLGVPPVPVCLLNQARMHIRMRWPLFVRGSFRSRLHVCI